MTRLDRLISDVSDASRLDAELSRITAEPVDVVPILRTLRELDEATRDAENDPRLVVDAPASLMVWAVEDRLVQVLRNLIANAQSFSPPRAGSRCRAGGRRDGGDQRRGRRPRHPGREPGADFRPILFRAADGENSASIRAWAAISRQIVEALRGGISAENRRGIGNKVMGARFVVRLPRA